MTMRQVEGSRETRPIVILAGKPLRPGTILNLLEVGLALRGVQVAVKLLHDGHGGTVPDGALIVHRGLSRSTLQWLAGTELQGRVLCNPVAHSLAAQDRPLLLSRLRVAGLPVPAFQNANDWPAALAAASGRDVVIKAADAAIGRGARIIFNQKRCLPTDAPFPGPYVIEARVTRDGEDRKLYVAGSRCFGLLKPWPRAADGRSVAFDPPEELQRLAFAAGRAVGLEIYGVDAVIGADGPVIVDLNVFPGFRGVQGGPDAVLAHVMRRVADAAT